MTIGDQIKNQRLELGWSREAVAMSADVSETTLYRLENNLKELIYKIVKEPKLITKMKKNISRISLSDNQNIILENILSND